MAYTVEVSKKIKNAFNLLIEDKSAKGLTQNAFSDAEDKFISRILNPSHNLVEKLDPDQHGNERYACKYLGVLAVVVKVDKSEELIIEALDYP